MAKAKGAASKSQYRCDRCGHAETKWMGRCPSCNEWNSLIEEVASTGRRADVAANAAPISVEDVADDTQSPRLMTKIAEVDRVLGGGVVPGSLVLLGGDPGVGKSTLLSQIMGSLAAQHAHHGKPVLYVTAEESTAQAALRLRRLGVAHPSVHIFAETDLEAIIHHAGKLEPVLLAIDSIQTISSSALDSVPGSLAQVRDCTGRLMQFAKQRNIATVLVGHVTKDGNLAGPKTLEHMVDVVLQFEADHGAMYRILRAHKNRFGSTQEIGVFEMRSTGLMEVPNPSALLLAERPKGAPGSVVVGAVDGTRPLLVEVQALVAPPASGFGRRTVSGCDPNRVALLLAVLAQRANCDVLSQDVFVNVAGGIKLTDPSSDLAIACAIASSARGRAIDAATLVFGELGLAGEIRAVPFAEARLAEAAKLGFKRCILPKQNAATLIDKVELELFAADRLQAAIGVL